VIRATQIVNNTGNGLFLNNDSYPRLVGNIYSGNAYNIVVPADDIVTSGTWSKDGSEPYVVLGDVSVNGGARLTISAGLELLFGVDAGLRIWDGMLTAVGKPDSQIVFTSLSGESNGWDGVYFSQYSDDGGRTSTLRHCMIEKAGLGGWGARYNLGCYATSQPTVDSCIIQKSSYYGVFLDSSPLKIRSCKIIDNDSIGVACQGTGKPMIGDTLKYLCHLYGNGKYDIYNNSADTVFARNNFWGTQNLSDIRGRIYDKYDNAAKGIVLFEPLGVLAHEVLVTALDYEKPGYMLGDTVFAAVQIANLGSNSEAVPVSLRIGSSYVRDTIVPIDISETITVDFPAWVPQVGGTYNVKAFTSLSIDEYKRDDTIMASVAVIEDTLAPVIDSISPNFGGNTGCRIIEIYGRRFAENMEVFLTGEGTATVAADTMFIFYVDSTKLIAIFDLTNVQLGVRNLEVRDRDGRIGIYRDAFEIQIGNQVITAGFSGRQVIRVGRPSRIEFWIRVEGNVDIVSAVITIQGLPKDAEVTVPWPILPPPQIPGYVHGEWTGTPVYVDGENDRALPLYRPYIKGGEYISSGFDVVPASPGNFDARVEVRPTGLTPTCLSALIGTALSEGWGMMPGAGCLALAPKVVYALVGGPMISGNLSFQPFVHIGGDAILGCVLEANPYAKAAKYLWKAYGYYCTYEKCTRAQVSNICDIPNAIMRFIAALSIDPNDKIGPGGYCVVERSDTVTYVRGDKPFTYQVYFENVDTAKIEAEDVIITDTLDIDLDWTSFTFGEVFPGAGPNSIRPSFNVITDFNPITGVATWTLENIMLPPDTAPYWGEGWVSYSVSPKADVTTDTRIENIAAIKFDYNPWILAPMDSLPVVTVIDKDAPTSSMTAFTNSTATAQTVASWNGNDVGAGVSHYELYVADSVAGSPRSQWELWKITAKMSDTLGNLASQGGPYKLFCAIAIDHVGNRERKDLKTEAWVKRIPTDVADNDGDNLPKSYYLAQNYPNPFNPMTEFAFAIPKKSHILLEVFNIIGQRVATVINKEMAAGQYTICWDGRGDGGENLASGIYLYRIKAGEFIATKKMIILK
jgi:hypothetical protein